MLKHFNPPSIYLPFRVLPPFQPSLVLISRQVNKVGGADTRKFMIDAQSINLRTSFMCKDCPAFVSCHIGHRACAPIKHSASAHRALHKINMRNCRKLPIATVSSPPITHNSHRFQFKFSSRSPPQPAREASLISKVPHREIYKQKGSNSSTRTSFVQRLYVLVRPSQNLQNNHK